MLKRDYLTRLSRAARWRLGAKEGTEVIADYRELVGDPPRTEEELTRDLGRPRDAVKPLTNQKEYRLWLAVFTVLAVGLAVVGWCAVVSWSPVVWHNLFGAPQRNVRVPTILILSAAIALVWFRRKGWKGEKLPHGVVILLAVVLAWIAVMMCANWAWMHDFYGFAEMWGKMPAPLGPGGMISRSIWILGDALELIGGAGMAVIGIVSLVKARTRDRRWAAVYILAMAAVLVSLETLVVMGSLDLSSGDAWTMLSPYFYRWLWLTVAGLVGTGVALC